MSSGQRYDIIKQNQDICDKIYIAITNAGKLPIDVCRDAANLGYKINHDVLKKYLSRNPGYMTDISHKTIMWLCTRYGVKLDITCNIVAIAEVDRTNAAIALGKKLSKL